MAPQDPCLPGTGELDFSVQIRQLVAPQPELDRPARARGARDEPALLQGDDHVVDRGRRDLEVSLHVGLGGRDTMDLRVIVDEGQVLALRVSVSEVHPRILDVRRLLVNRIARLLRCLMMTVLVMQP